MWNLDLVKRKEERKHEHKWKNQQKPAGGERRKRKDGER
jgi:hypothetical protein